MRWDSNSGTYSDTGQSLERSIQLGAHGVLDEEVEQVLGHGVRMRVANDRSPSAQPNTRLVGELHQNISNTSVSEYPVSIWCRIRWSLA